MRQLTPAIRLHATTTAGQSRLYHVRKRNSLTMTKYVIIITFIAIFAFASLLLYRNRGRKGTRFLNQLIDNGDVGLAYLVLISNRMKKDTPEKQSVYGALGDLEELGLKNCHSIMRNDLDSTIESGTFAPREMAIRCAQIVQTKYGLMAGLSNEQFQQMISDIQESYPRKFNFLFTY